MNHIVVVGSIAMWNKDNSELPLGRVASYIQKRQDESYQIAQVIDVNKKEQI